MTLVRKLNKFGAILILIDSIFELFNLMAKNTPWYIGLICLLLGIFIFIITPQLEYDYKVQWATAAIAAQWFANSYFHEGLGYSWATGVGIIGFIIVIVAGALVILGATLGELVVQNIGLFKPHQYFLFGIEIIAIHNTMSFFLKIMRGLLIKNLIPELACYIFIGIMLIGTLLIKLKKKLMGSLTVWIINNLSSILTGINGFLGGSLVLGLFGFIMGTFMIYDHWADPYKRKTRVPRRNLSIAIKDAYFALWLGILFTLKSKKIKKLEKENRNE